MVKEPFVSIIVLNWNGASFIRQCLESLLNQTYPESNYEIIIVDNASTDKSVDIITKHFSNLRLIVNKKNYGFAGGNNVGIKAAKGNLIALFNNDAIADEKWLDKLVSGLLSNKDAGIVSGPIFFFEPSDVIWSAGARFDPITGLNWHLAKYEKIFDPLEERDYFTMCAILIKKEVFEKIGLLDDHFFIYAEDFSFCLQAQQAGFKLQFVPDAVTWHRVSMSVSRDLTLGQYHFLKSGFKLILKLWPLWYLPITLFMKLLVIPFLEVSLMKLPFKTIIFTWRAFRDALVENKKKGVIAHRIRSNNLFKPIRFLELVKVISRRNKQLYKIRHKNESTLYTFFKPTVK